MDYQDTGALGTGGIAPDARNDADSLPAGDKGPATGNTITGTGTVTGTAGADVIANGPAEVVELQGAGGIATGSGLQVAGQFGMLSMASDGDYRYVPNADAPNGARDVFSYTIADAMGARDSATLTIEIGRTPNATAETQQIIPGPDGVVILPAGVELSDIHVVGRNLVIDMPDGSQMVIIDGAVFVPQLVLGGVEVPATNLAALLIDAEPQPAAGTPQSSGGNFGIPVGPLDPGVPLGDLIPPTELDYTPPEFEDVGQFEDNEPEIFVQPDGQPASVAAVDSVDEAGLPEREIDEDVEPEGSNSAANSETTSGTIIYDSPDEPNVITINGEVITSVGQEIEGDFGTLTITSIANGAIGYSYTLADNTSGDDTHDDFLVSIEDNNGDVASATLRIDIIDDVPTARPDTDSIAAGQFGPATGNVITDAHPGDEGDSDTNAADTVGADDAELTAVTGAGETSIGEGGEFIVEGEYGVLTIDSEGNYSYVRNEGTPGGVEDVFTYTITDGDGDPSTSTLTITIANLTVTVGENPDVLTDDDAVVGADGNPGTPEVGDDADGVNLEGTLSGSGGDGDLTFDLLTTGAPDGFSYVDGPDGSVLVQQVQDGETVTVLTITIDAASGAYTVTQNAPILHDSLDGEEGDDLENNISFTINYRVTDVDDDFADGTLTIDVDDDTPVAVEAQLGGTVDEDGLEAGIAGGENDVEGEDTIVSGNVAALFSAGADQPLTYSLLANFAGLPELTSNGVEVSYAVTFDGETGVHTLTASAGEATVFTFTLDSETGAYEFELLGQLDHDSLDGEEVGDDTENPVGTDIEIALGSIIQATDADGDSVTANDSGLIITVDDDSPEASEAELGGTVDEDGLEAGIAGGENDVEGEDTTVSGSVATLFNSGADQPLTYALLADTSGLPSLTSNNVEVTYDVTFDAETGVYTLTASAGESTVFTFTLDSESGAYEFELLGQLDHASLDDLTGDDTENPVGTDIEIALGSIIQATDADGDSVIANDSGLVITVDDDTPEAVTDVNVGGTVDEDGLEAGIPGGVNDVEGESTLVEGDVSDLFNSGADQPLTYSLNLDTSGLPQDLTSNNVPVTYVVDGNTLTAWAGQAPIFTFTIDPETGEYSFELQGQLDHPSLNGEEGDDTENPDDSDLAIDLSSVVQATDADGDTVTAADGGLVITVDDDSPEASEAELGGTVDEDGLEAGIAGGENDVDGEDTLVSGSVTTLFNSGADQPLTYALLADTSGLPALTSNDVEVTYEVTFDAETGVYTLTASAGESPVFTFTLDSESGAYEFELLGQLDHDSLDGETGDDTENPVGTDIEIALGSIIQATDADGDSVTANDSGLVITVDDDTPTANLETQLTGTVDEDGLDGGNPGGDEDVEGEETTATGSVSTLFNSGADQPLTFSLSSITSGLPQDLTSNGVLVTYEVAFDSETGTYTLTASAGENPVFTFTLNSETGDYEFELLDQLDHPSLDGEEGDDTENPDDSDLAIDFSSIIVATDADGDSVTAADGGLIVTVDDDSPEPFEDCPDDVIVINEDGSSFTGSLNLPPVGADQLGTVIFLVDDGAPVLDSEGEQISSNGELLYYFVNEDGVLEARAGDENGDVIFTITLNGDGTFTYDQIGDITSTTTLSITNLDSVGGGNVDAKAIDVPDSPFDLILSTQPGKTVNTNANEMGVDTGNDMDVGEILRVDLVQNAFVTGSGGGAVLNYGEYYTATAYRQDVSGVGNDDGTGGPQRADFIVRAIVAVEAGAGDADGDAIFYGDPNDTFVADTSINLYNSTGQLVDPADYAALGIAVTEVTDGWAITGLPNGYDFEIVSETPFNAVQIESLDSTDTFKLGFIDITSTVQTDVDLSVPIALEDADGDKVVCDIDLFLGAPVNAPGVTITVNEAGLDTVGSMPGSDSETQSGNLNDYVTGGTGPYTFALVSDGDGDFGTLTLNPETGEFSYTLDTPVDSDPSANDGTNVEPMVEVFEYEVTDDNGVTTTATIRINVIDDVPTAVEDSDSVSDGGPLVAEGNVLTDAHAGDEGDTDDGADTFGADRPANVINVSFGGGQPVAAGTDIAGKYGTLELNADGTYTYTLNPNDADYGDIVALDSGEFINEVFTYTMADADGDRSSTTLTIRINGINDAPTGEAGTAVVSEEGLNGGNTDEDPASDDTDSASDLTGDLDFVDPDGDALTYSLGEPAGDFADADGNPISWVVSDEGQTLTGSSILGPVITITINGSTGEYDVVLSRGMDHGDDGNTESEFSIIVPVTVSDGTVDVPTTITVEVEDDKPTVNVTTNSDSAIEAVTQDADTDGDPTEQDSSGPISFAGAFNLAQSVGGDGGATASLTYALGFQAGASGLTSGGATIYLYEIGGNIVGSTADDQDDVDATNTIFDVSVVESGAGAGNVTLTQYGPIDHGDVGSLTDSEISLADTKITLTASATVTDADGDSVSDSETIDIGANLVFEDDAPTAEVDSDTIESGSNDPATGNVITDAAAGDAGDDDDGADSVGADVPGRIVSITFDGTTIGVPADGFQTIGGDFGTLTIWSNGDYSYARDDGTPGDASDIFTYTLEDFDGDQATATLTISIEDAPVTVSIPDGEAETHVYENALGTEPQGTSEAADPGANDDPNEVVTGTITFNALDGLGSITIGTTTLDLDAAYPQTVADDATGKLEITGVTYDETTGAGTISYRYTLEDNTLGVQATDGGNTTVSFDVDIVDGDGDHSPDGNLVITIVDDAPIAADDSNSVLEGGDIVNATVLSNDLSGADDYNGAVVGAALGSDDSVDHTNMVGGEIELIGTWGTLTLRADGTYDYAAFSDSNPPADAQDEFVYTIRDGDGDLDSAVLTIDVDDVTLVADNDTQVVNEAALDLVDDPADLAAGNVEGSDPDSGAETVTGQLTVTGGVGTIVYAHTGGTATHGVFNLNSDGSYTYTLTDPVDGATADDGPLTEEGVESFTYTATDENGNTVQGTITIDVIDDVPTARDDTDAVTEDTNLSASGNVITGVGEDGDLDGGDTEGADSATVTFVDGTNTGVGTVVPDANGETIQGQYGTLTINSAGGYTYTLYTVGQNATAHAAVQALGAGQTLTESFDYTLTDGDGDTSIAELVITINGTNDAPEVTADAVAVSDEGTGTSPNADEDGIDDTTDDATASGQIGIVDADGNAAISIALGIPADTFTVDGIEIDWALSESDTVLTGSVAGFGDVIIIEVTDAEGNYDVTLLRAIDQAGDLNTETDIDIIVPVSVSDGIAPPVESTITVTVEDDSPLFDSAVDAVVDPDSDNTFVGQFNYSIGADEHIELDETHEISLDEVRGQVGGVDITIVGAIVYDADASDDTVEVFTFDFTYQPNPDDPATESNSATVTFNKVTGEYSVVLDEGIQSYSTPSVQEDATVTFHGGGPSQWDTAVASFNVGTEDEIHIQFTGDVGDNTQPFTTVGAGDPGSFTDGDIFIGNDSWVSISSAQIAAGGNSLQSKNILDFNFYEDNPGATTGGTATASALGAFIVLDQLGSGEDMVLVLKLADPDNIGGTITTRILIVEYADIYVQGETPPEGYPVPGQNQGVIIVEANDYAHLVPEGYELVGMQLTTSTEGITGSGYNFNGLSGVADEGTTSFADAGTSDQDVIKILDIGVIIPVENQEALNLELDVTVTDSDGDSFSQTLLVNPPETEVMAATMMVSKEAVNDNSDTSSYSLLAGDSFEQQLQKSSGGGNNSVLYGAVAAAGLMAAPAAAGYGGFATLDSGSADFSAAMAFGQGAYGAGAEGLGSLASLDSMHLSFEGNSGALSATGMLPLDAWSGNVGMLSDSFGGTPQSATLLQPGTDSAMPALASAEMSFAQGVMMPSSEMLAAAFGSAGGGQPQHLGLVDRILDGQAANDALGGQAQHTGEVARVIADALAGGDGGLDIDALLSGLPGHGGGGGLIAEALASQGAGGVSAWDMGAFGGFTAMHSAFTMEMTILHHDAVQAA